MNDWLNKLRSQELSPLLYYVEVPPEQQNARQDIPSAYAVLDVPDANAGIVIYGYYENRGEWIANPWSPRWLVRHLILQSKEQP